MNRIAVRLSVGLLVAVLLSVVGVQVLLHWQMSRAIGRDAPIHERLAGEALRRYVGTVAPHERAQAVAELVRALGIPAELRTRDDPWLPEPARKTLGERGILIERGMPPEHVLMVAIPGSNEILRVGPMRPVRPPPTWPLIVSLVGLVIVVAVTATLLARPLVRRVRTFQSVALRIANGDLGARVQISGNDAFGEFASQFNQMADRNQILLEKQRDLMRAVAHELRTPAARIRFALELIQEATTEQQRERHILAIDSDLSEVDSLVRELLLLDHLESDPDATAGETFPVLRAIDDEIERLRLMRPQIEVSTTRALPDGVSALGSEKLFRRALRNLVSNALRHASGRVHVSATGGARELVISIDDDGSGIPPADRARILEPFSRLDRSRSRETGGFGLGLTIVSRILRAAGGRLKIGDADLGGASVVMSWPLHEAR
jgi:two-component system sensor histidine kinase RstB